MPSLDELSIVLLSSTMPEVLFNLKTTAVSKAYALFFSLFVHGRHFVGKRGGGWERRESCYVQHVITYAQRRLSPRVMGRLLAYDGASLLEEWPSRSNLSSCQSGRKKICLFVTATVTLPAFHILRFTNVIHHMQHLIHIHITGYNSNHELDQLPWGFIAQWLEHRTGNGKGWLMSNFPRSLTKNITSHSMKNLAFHHLLRWKIIILPILITPLMHFSLGRLGECTFSTWEWKGQARISFPASCSIPYSAVHKCDVCVTCNISWHFLVHRSVTCPPRRHTPRHATGICTTRRRRQGNECSP